MNNKSIIHLILLVGGTLFATYNMWFGVVNYFEGRPDFTLGRIATSILLITYIWANTIAYINRRSNVIMILAFPIIYTALGLLSWFWWLGHIKNWAPSTKEEADLTSMLLVVIIITIYIIGFLITRSKNIFKTIE